MKIQVLSQSEGTTTANNVVQQVPELYSVKNQTIQKVTFPSDIITNSSYKNGVIMSAYNLVNRTRDQLYADRVSIQKGQIMVNSDQSPISSDTLCSIFMPPSMSVVENHSFDYEDGKDGWLTMLQQKGIAGVVGNTIMGTIEQVTGGVLQEQYGQAIDKRTKLQFKDSVMREMLYLNTFTFNNIFDLVSFAQIYYLFSELGYPKTIQGGGKLGEQIQNISAGYKKFIDGISEGAGDKSLIGSALDSIADFSIIEVPPVWKIQQFNKTSASAGNGSIETTAGILPVQTFGPAALLSVRFNKTPTSLLQTFNAFPNDPVSVEVELRFKELFPLRQQMIFDSDETYSFGI